MPELMTWRLLPSDRIAPADFDADNYSTDNLSFWTPLLIELGGISPGQRVLDIGCATGGFAIALAKQTGAHVIGCDLSMSFLAFARMKSPDLVAWTAGDVQNLPFNDGSFNCVVASLLLHQVADRTRALTEGFRVLRSSGAMVIRTILPEDIAMRIPFRFFPALAQQQEAVMPSLGELTDRAHAVGFERIHVRRVCRDKGLYLDEVEGSFRREAACRYRFLTQQDLDEGVQRMRADWQRAGHRWIDPRPTHFIVAGKP